MVEVSFEARSEGLTEAFLLIPSNDAAPSLARVSLSGSGRHPVLTVTRGGSGDGKVIDSSGSIDCGVACSAQYQAGSTVTLTAEPGAGASMTGWLGAGCTGTRPCILRMDADLAVRADFALRPPTADFRAQVQPPDGTVPLTLFFSDASDANPSKWFWNFGDGHHSSQRNPAHTYTSAGDYTVSLVACNATGCSEPVTRPAYVTAVACSNNQILLDDHLQAPASLQDAYFQSGDGGLIRMQGLNLNESLVADQPKRAILKGGYDCQYSWEGPNPTSVSGLIIESGTLEIDRIALQ
jgi:PKD repeat protein